MDTTIMTQAEIKTYLASLTDAQQLELVPQLAQDKRKSIQQLAKRLLKKRLQAEKEAARLESLWFYERQARRQGYHQIVGTDEAGRGPLAGPVVAAAVILPENAQLTGINDSKKLSEAQREALYEQITKQAVCYAICEIDNLVIDELNILEASRLAMAQAVDKLAQAADFVLVDGWQNPRLTVAQQGIVQGDSKSISIAAASILAKVHRDHLMEEYDKLYPGYGLAKHKGYPTAEHYQALKKLGPSAIHRLSFNLKLDEIPK